MSIRQTFFEHLEQIRELAGKSSLDALQKQTVKNVNTAYRTNTSRKDRHIIVAQAAQASSLGMVKGRTKDGPKLWLKKALKQAKIKRNWKQRSS